MERRRRRLVHGETLRGQAHERHNSSQARRHKRRRTFSQRDSFASMNAVKSSSACKRACARALAGFVGGALGRDAVRATLECARRLHNLVLLAHVSHLACTQARADHARRGGG
jgi:hypothetical protein